MRKLIFGVLALSIMGLFFACQKDSQLTTTSDLMNSIASASNKQTVAVSQLPVEVRDYVDMNFTPIDIEAAWHAKNLGYEVELEDGQDLYFRDNGDCLGFGFGHGLFRCMKGDTVTVDDLPADAVNYIGTAYAGLTIEIVVAKPMGGFAVELSDGTILLFNAAGEYFKLCGEHDGDGDGPHSGGHGPHGGGGGHHQFGGGPGGHGGPNGPSGGCIAGDTIEVTDLPTLAQSYIAANYAGIDIVVVVVKGSGKFGVEFANGVVALFNEDGEFIKECDGTPPGGPGHHDCENTITLTDLPTAAQDYIAAEYPDVEFKKGCLKFNGNFIVKLTNDVKILFDPDGNVLFDSGN